MGNRANVIVRADKDDQVYFYAHWSGEGLFDTAREVIKKGQRWEDHAYLGAILARAIFLRWDPKLEGETGFGISSDLGDNEHPILVLDCENQTVYFEGEDGSEVKRSKALSFGDFSQSNGDILKAFGVGREFSRV
jgi:hypothetical protein